MPLQVNYLSKLAQCRGERVTSTASPIMKGNHLVNKNQALDWMAAQIAVIIGFEDGRLSENESDEQALTFAKDQCEKKR